MTPFHSILIAADFSEQSVAAFHVACSLADETRTQLRVIHAVPPPLVLGELDVPVAIQHESPAALMALREQLRSVYVPNRPLPVDYRVVDGIPADRILEEASGMSADLVVLGTHGRTGLSRLLTGSVAEAVLRRANVPVLAMHVPDSTPRVATPIRFILHPTDFTPAAANALAVAREVARDFGARLMLLHVAPFELMSGVALAPPQDPESYLQPLHELRARIDGPDLKYPVETECVRGDPAARVVQAAEELRPDLIVMGTHGRTGLARLLMGSVAESVLRRAPCPTLIIREGAVLPAGAAVGAETSGPETPE